MQGEDLRRARRAMKRLARELIVAAEFLGPADSPKRNSVVEGNPELRLRSGGRRLLNSMNAISNVAAIL